MHLGGRLNENQGTNKACNNVLWQTGYNIWAGAPTSRHGRPCPLLKNKSLIDMTLYKTGFRTVRSSTKFNHYVSRHLFFVLCALIQILWQKWIHLYYVGNKFSTNWSQFLSLHNVLQTKYLHLFELLYPWNPWREPAAGHPVSSIVYNDRLCLSERIGHFNVILLQKPTHLSREE